MLGDFGLSAGVLIVATVLLLSGAGWLGRRVGSHAGEEKAGVAPSRGYVDRLFGR